MTTTDDPWLRELLSGDRLSDPRDADRMAAALAAREPEVDRGGGATRALLSALAAAWERGWQPSDVVHAGRGANARAARLAVALVAEDARVTDAVRRTPAAWGEQLRELGAQAPGDPAVVAAWHRAGRRRPEDAWRDVLQLATALTSLA